ncbi:hypothetical protein RBRAMI_0861 [Pseudomonas aeruginosa RB]|nr:hypothetical protein RBRAMI_0861 [Pseudomonas aeruginosa RB]
MQLKLDNLENVARVAADEVECEAQVGLGRHGMLPVMADRTGRP